MADAATLRPYQLEAVESASDALSRGPRTQVWAACGTGKTVMAIHLIEQLYPLSGTVIVLCPTLPLVSQVLNDWADHHRASGSGRRYQALVVASDATDAERRFAERGTKLPVTTTVAEISDWLDTPTAGLRIIVGTHLSAGQLGKALLHTNREADLLVVDEAHHTAGHRDKHGTLVHHDDKLPARQRLYLTATPRVLASSSSPSSGDELLSMGDEETYGPVAYHYPFSRAIAEGWLDDYRVVVIGVARAEILAHLRMLQDDPRTSTAHPIAPHEAAVQIAIARAAAEWGLRRIIAYAPTVAAAARLARDLPVTVARAGVGPARPLTSDYIVSEHDGAQRSLKLQRLRHPPDAGWTVLSNVRVLGEGIDIPAIDAVVFTHPKRSTIEVVQAVGRAMRPHPEGRGTATILVPILLPDAPSELDDISEDSSFSALWQVVRALRAHDDVLAADLDRRRREPDDHRSQEPLARVITRLPEAFDNDAWMRALTLRIVRAGSSPWWEGLGAATRYRDQHGDLDVPPDYVAPDSGFRLGEWIKRQRRTYREGGMPSERVTALEKLGIVWDPRQQLWSSGLGHLARWHARHGHLDIPARTHSEDGFPIGAWLRKRRDELGQGRLAAASASELSAIDPLWAEPGLRVGLLAADRYHAASGPLGALRRSSQYRDPKTGFKLGQWLQECRGGYHDGVLNPVVREHLTALGIDWSMPNRKASPRQLEALARFREAEHQAYLEEAEQFLIQAQHYVDQHGDLNVPIRPSDLGQWLNEAKHRYKRGRLPDTIKERLDAIDTTWADPRRRPPKD